MLVCDLPCQVCNDTTQVKFVALGYKQYADEAVMLNLEHNAGHTDTVLMREGED